MLLALAALVAGLGPPVAEAAAAPADKPATPELIERAQQSGEVDGTRATQLRAYALAAPERLPANYRSNAPWDGTLTLRRIHRALPRLPDGPAKREITALAGPSTQAVTSCSTSSGNLPNSTDTTHFHVDYSTIASPLTISQYANSLESTWTKEVTDYGWAAPPVKTSNPPPGNRYAVRVDNLSPGLYGYVSSSGSYAGLVGNNPNTAWNEGDSYASCMVLSDDYAGFPSTPQASLDSTTSHEFNHSLQYGYGALTGTNAASASFTEAGATWMEDEVFDSSNDNYNYLWPDFRQSMASYDPTFPYPYWIALRGITEPYGTGAAGQGEDVMQDFWERTSKNEAGNLSSMEQAVLDKGTTLPNAFHNYAIAVKFSKSCAGGNGLFPPDCFEEGNSYAAAAGGRPASSKTITTVPGSATDTVADAYAIQWTSLPTSGPPYSVRLTNSSAGGLMRGTLACNPGAGSPLQLQALPSTVGAGQSTTLKSFDPTGCNAPVLVTTNSAHATANPAAPAARSMQVQTLALQTLTVAKAGSGFGQVSSSPAGIDCGVDCSEKYTNGTPVTLTAAPATGSVFTGWSGGGCSGTGSCTLTMDAAKNVTASFEPSAPPGEQTLIAAKGGSGTGSVTSDPVGINCGPDCSENYPDGTSVTLTATPAAGSSFTGWSGDASCPGTDDTCIVKMDQGRTVTATFEADQPLTVTKSGSGSGLVSSTPAGVDCGSDCNESYTYGTSVTLSAAPAAGSAFTGWSGACSGTGPCTVTMDAARGVGATFAPLTSSQPSGSLGGFVNNALTLPPDVFPPILGALKLTASRFRASPARGTQPPVGTRIRYSLSESALLRIRVERAMAGRRVGSSCRTPSPSNRGNARCIRWVRVGSFSKRGDSGSNFFLFRGRLGGRKMKPGMYRFVVVARDAAGNASAARRKRFHIVR